MRPQRGEQDIGNGAKGPFSAEQWPAPLMSTGDAFHAVREDGSRENHLL